MFGRVHMGSLATPLTLSVIIFGLAPLPAPGEICSNDKLFVFEDTGTQAARLRQSSALDLPEDLGWIPTGSGAQGTAARHRPSRPAGPSAHRESGACDDSGTQGRTLASVASVHPRVPSVSGRRVRAWSLQGRALLATARPRAHDRRGLGEEGARVRDEIDLGAAGAGGESGVSTIRSRSRRSLSRPRAADASRSAECSRVCAVERAEALSPAKRNGSARAAR